MTCLFFVVISFLICTTATLKCWSTNQDYVSRNQSLYGLEIRNDTAYKNTFFTTVPPRTYCFNIYVISIAPHSRYLAGGSWVHDFYMRNIRDPIQLCTNRTDPCTMRNTTSGKLNYLLCCCDTNLCNNVTANPLIDPLAAYKDFLEASAIHACYDSNEDISECSKTVADGGSSQTKCYSIIHNSAHTEKSCSRAAHLCVAQTGNSCVRAPEGYHVCCCEGLLCNAEKRMDSMCRRECAPTTTTTTTTSTTTTSVSQMAVEPTTTDDEEADGGGVSAMLVIGWILVFLLVVALIALIAVFLLKYKLKRRDRADNVTIDPKNRAAVSTVNDLKGEAIDDCGFIGTAFVAVITNAHIPCILKEFYPKIVDVIDFEEKKWQSVREELHQLRHINLTRVYQIFWPDHPNHPSPLIVYEKVGNHRSINAYFRARAEAGDFVELHVKYGSLAQIASAMEYLHSFDICNPYLGGRNVIVDEGPNAADGEVALKIDIDSRKGGLPVVKLTDFVLDFVLAQRLEIQFLDAKFPELPVRWLAPESLEQNLFDKQTDSWAFGIFAWEVMHDGKRPYDGSSNVDVAWQILEGRILSADTLQHDKKMKELIFERCLVYVDFSERPTMEELKTTLIGFYSGKDTLPAVRGPKCQAIITSDDTNAARTTDGATTTTNTTGSAYTSPMGTTVDSPSDPKQKETETPAASMMLTKMKSINKDEVPDPANRLAKLSAPRINKDDINDPANRFAKLSVPRPSATWKATGSAGRKPGTPGVGLARTPLTEQEAGGYLCTAADAKGVSKSMPV